MSKTKTKKNALIAEPAAESAAVSTQQADTVIVAVNYPHNINFTVPDRRGLMRDVVLNGNATQLQGKPMGILPVGSYGLTEIDANAWDYIKNYYAGLPLIQNGLIFAATGDRSYAADAAAERKGERNGMEPIDSGKTVTTPAKADEL